MPFMGTLLDAMGVFARRGMTGWKMGEMRTTGWRSTTGRRDPEAPADVRGSTTSTTRTSAS
jgi:hypothetical protein